MKAAIPFSLALFAACGHVNGSSPQFATNEFVFRNNLFRGLIATGGSLSVCVEYRDIQTPDAAQKAERDRITGVVADAVHRLASSAGPAPAIAAYSGEFGTCFQGDLNNGKVVVHLVTSENALKLRAEADGLTYANIPPAALAYALNRLGKFVVATHRLIPTNPSATLENVVLHEIGHLFGLADTYANGPYFSQGATDGQTKSVMSMDSSETLTPDDVAGLKAVAAAVKNERELVLERRREVKNVCGQGWEKYEPATEGTARSGLTLFCRKR